MSPCQPAPQDGGDAVWRIDLSQAWPRGELRRIGPNVMEVTANDLATQPCARHMDSMDVGAMAHRGNKMTKTNGIHLHQVAGAVTVVVAGIVMSTPFMAVGAFVLKLY